MRYRHPLRHQCEAGAAASDAAGEKVEDDGKTWELTLREGLKFHDGTPVLARDAVASIKRSGQRDPLLNVMIQRMDEISAPSDKVIRIRLKRPFPLMRDALSGYSACVMPERIAATDANSLPEVVGSGPFSPHRRARAAKSPCAQRRLCLAPTVPSFTAGPDRLFRPGGVAHPARSAVISAAITITRSTGGKPADRSAAQPEAQQARKRIDPTARSAACASISSTVRQKKIRRAALAAVDQTSSCSPCRR